MQGDFGKGGGPALPSAASAARALAYPPLGYRI